MIEKRSTSKRYIYAFGGAFLKYMHKNINERWNKGNRSIIPRTGKEKSLENGARKV